MMRYEFSFNVGVDPNAVQRTLTGVVGVVSAEWVILGPDFGDTPIVNTKQYFVGRPLCVC